MLRNYASNALRHVFLKRLIHKINFDKSLSMFIAFFMGLLFFILRIHVHLIGMLYPKIKKDAL